jgi:hypothetical protein
MTGEAKERVVLRQKSFKCDGHHIDSCPVSILYVQQLAERRKAGLAENFLSFHYWEL